MCDSQFIMLCCSNEKVSCLISVWVFSLLITNGCIVLLLLLVYVRDLCVLQGIKKENGCSCGF